MCMEYQISQCFFQFQEQDCYRSRDPKTIAGNWICCMENVASGLDFLAYIPQHSQTETI